MQPGPAKYKRDVTLELHARRTRKNEAGDQVAGSQDSRTRKVRNLHLTDIQCTSSTSSQKPHRRFRW